MVSPLLLGRFGDAPCRVAESALDRFDPLRWHQDRVRPGAWLPFGAGPHACPGRNLGLAQLTHLAGWARDGAHAGRSRRVSTRRRGIFPRPARLGHVDRHGLRVHSRPDGPCSRFHPLAPLEGMPGLQGVPAVTAGLARGRRARVGRARGQMTSVSRGLEQVAEHFTTGRVSDVVVVR